MTRIPMVRSLCVCWRSKDILCMCVMCEMSGRRDSRFVREKLQEKEKEKVQEERRGEGCELSTTFTTAPKTRL